jgi:two-component system, NtrC family, sensor kinase
MTSKERRRQRKVFIFLAVITVALIATAIMLGYFTSSHMRSIIRSQYNEQQLFLARGAVRNIENNIQYALSDLILLNSMPAIQYADQEAYEVMLLSILPVLNRNHIIEIRRVNSNGNTLFVANEQGVSMQHFGPKYQDAAAYHSWASAMANRGKAVVTGIRHKDASSERRVLLMDLIIPTYEDSVDRQHPRPSHRFSGYLRATMDVSRLLSQVMPSIRSGNTGYAWAMDSSGIFLYHPEPSFIGENAFDARSSRNPNISFKQINQIQQEEMVKGKEGTGSYISGWHRDVVQPMEKLLAYSPLRIQGPFGESIWSVAVVVPVQEVEGAVSAAYNRQMMFQGTIILIILLGASMVVLHELRLSTILEHEVAEKTEDLRLNASRLERSEQKYRTLVESAEDLIFTIDSEGVIQTANQHMTRLFGQNETKLPGQSLFRFLPKEQAEAQLAMVKQVSRSHRGLRTESRFCLRQQDFWFNIQYIPIKDPAEGRELILGIARDITEIKSFEKQLINTEKLASLGTMAAGVAHEINNPLGIMLGFCELLIERMEPGTMEYNDLKTVERHGLHCKGIVENLLSFARISEDTEECCEVNRNIDEILTILRHALKMKGIELSTDLDPGLPMIKADSRGLQQVILNLISNAIHAMEPKGKGRLGVATRRGRSSEWVDIEVSDTGCGIPPQFMEKIFDPFFTTKKVGEGTGLGLSVSYGIVTKFGGTISCESSVGADNPSKAGTTFVISLQACLHEDRELGGEAAQTLPAGT